MRGKRIVSSHARRGAKQSRVACGVSGAATKVSSDTGFTFTPSVTLRRGGARGGCAMQSQCCYARSLAPLSSRLPPTRLFLARSVALTLSFSAAISTFARLGWVLFGVADSCVPVRCG